MVVKQTSSSTVPGKDFKGLALENSHQFYFFIETTVQWLLKTKIQDWIWFWFYDPFSLASAKLNTFNIGIPAVHRLEGERQNNWRFSLSFKVMDSIHQNFPENCLSILMMEYAWKDNSILQNNSFKKQSHDLFNCL